MSRASLADTVADLLRTSLASNGAPQSFLLSDWKFALRARAVTHVQASDLERQLWHRRVLVCGNPLGGNFIDIPSETQSQFVILDCCGYSKSKRYGFCSQDFVSGDVATWLCDTDNVPVTHVFEILACLRRYVFPCLALLGVSAGCQTVAAIAASQNVERLEWTCRLSVFVLSLIHI